MRPGASLGILCRNGKTGSGDTVREPIQTADAGAGFVRAGQGQASADQVTLVPGIEVALLSLDLPGRLRGQAREQVARRQLADRMGLSEEDTAMRPFARPGEADRWTGVFLMARERLDAWRGLAGRAVLPDYLALPTAEDVWTVAHDPETASVQVRLGPGDGFSAAPAVTLALLERALAETPPPAAILRLGAPSEALDAWLRDTAIPVTQSGEEIAALGLPAPQTLAHGELLCDLRNDPLAARARLARQVLPWRWPLLLAGLAVLLWSAAQLIAIDRLDTRREAVATATRDLVREHFVPTGPILDIRVQVSRALAERRSAATGDETGDDPIALAGRVAEVIARSEAQPEEISYTRAGGLTLVLRLPDFAAAERIATLLDEAGIAATVTESRARENAAGVRSTFQIGDAGARP